MNENSSLSSNFWANFRQILVLPKWAKVFLVALSGVAVAGLIAAFGLKAWAADKVDSGEIVLKGIDRGAQERILKAESAENSVVPSKFAYQNRLYFARLDFLLRSKVIAYIDIQGISWAEGVDKNAVSDISSHNRHIYFISSQDFISQGFADKNLGQVSYKMDFSPLIATILKYYLIITLGFILAVFAYRLLVLTENGEIKLTQSSLPSALWQGYKNIKPLYRHTFWIVFIAMNLVFGFHTVQFLYGVEDWAYGLFKEYNMFLFGYQGRYTQNIISMFFEGQNTLPFLNNALAFAALSLAVVWLCIYLNIQRKLWIWVIVGFVLVLQPFTLTRMYFSYQAAGLFIAVAIGILGFILAKKAGEFSTAQPNSLSLSLWQAKFR